MITAFVKKVVVKKKASAEPRLWSESLMVLLKSPINQEPIGFKAEFVKNYS